MPSALRIKELRNLSDNVLLDNGTLTNNVQFPAGHVIQTKSITYGFSGDINITDGDVGASGVNAVGGAEALDEAIRALYRRRWSLTLNATGQLVAWILGAIEIWLAL